MDVTIQDLRQYMVDCRQRGKFEAGHHPWMEATDKRLSPHTLHMHARTIKTFFNWATRDGYYQDNPAGNMSYPLKPKGRTETYDDAQLIKILAEAQKLSFRDYALVFLMLDSGLRRSEVVGLSIDDVNVFSGLVRVKEGAKFGKYREVHVGHNCRSVLRQYLNSHREAKPGVDAFFTTRTKDPITYETIGGIMRRLNDRLPFRVHAHKCRHTFATNLAEQGENAFQIAYALGHEDIATARLYVHLGQRKQEARQSPMDKKIDGQSGR
ncbi:MAG: tyrosine-type recombinase/integrase [Anaerolineae bacterium]|nr:tyrosine-type recombinase/integrase [Anaerolineae bacterium]